jgi:membrane-associated phospholipid phosphatase
VVPLLQVAVLSSAMFIGYSRIQDNMHHWSDVLIGLVAGFTVASFVVIFFK